ncbi:MAG: hypothetical protein ACAH10_01140 [Methylophilaceae bacterium]
MALGCLLGYLDLRFADINWREQYPNLAKHYLSMMKRAAFKNTVPGNA